MSGGPLKRTATVVAIVAVLIAIYYALPFRGRRWWVGVVLGLVVVTALLPVTVRRARAVRQSDAPFADAIAALVFILTALVLGFATTYYALAQHASGQMGNLSTKTDGLYFTVTVLSTVGFGDIVPVGQAARAIVTVQMVFDFTFIAAAVRVIAWVARERAGEHRGAVAEPPGDAT